MATEQALKSISMLAGADLSTKQFYIVKVSAADTVVLAAAGTDFVLGVLQDNPTSGKVGAVAIDGVTKCVASGAIAAGVKVTSDAAGKAVAATAGQYVLGVTKTASGADGEILEVILKSSAVPDGP